MDLLESVWKAYVCCETATLDRLKYAVFGVYFIRYWRQFCEDKKISLSHFITKNTWDGLEMNLAMLIRLILDKEAHNIYQHNSQNNEAYFRKARSYSPVGSTMVNFDAHEFQQRAHKIAYEEKIYRDLPDISFPSHEKKLSLPIRQPEEFTTEEIEQTIATGISIAQEKASLVGMQNFNVELYKFLKVPKDGNKKKEISPRKNPFEVSNSMESPEENDVDENLVLDNISFAPESTGFIF